MSSRGTSAACELEEGEISDDAEETVKFESSRASRVPRPPPSKHHFGNNPHPDPSPPRHYKKPLRCANTQNGPPPSVYGRGAKLKPREPRPSDGTQRGRSSPPLRNVPVSSRERTGVTNTSQSPAVGDGRGRRSSQLEHYSWFRRSEGAEPRREDEAQQRSRSTPLRTRNKASPSPPPSARKNHSQPTFLQNPVKSEPSYEDLLAQYRSIQNQLEDLKKHSIEEHGASRNANGDKSASRKADGKKKRHQPKCRKAKKNLSEARDGSSEAQRDKRTSEKPETHGAEIENGAAPVENGHLSPVLLDVSDISDDDWPVQRPVMKSIVTCDFKAHDPKTRWLSEEDLLELRRKALESIRKAKEREEAKVTDNEDDNVSLLVLEELPSDLLETDLPIQEVQEKQQLKKGQKAPWYDRELTQQMRRKDRAYHKWKRHPCYDNWEAFKSLKREYNRMLKRKRAAFAQSSSDGATVAVATPAVVERTKAGVPEEEQTAEGDVEATAADSPEVAIVDAAESSCDSTTLPLESIPLPDFVSGDNYEPVEMEVDSDDATETPTLEVPDGSEDEDEAALREQLLQAVMRNRVTKAPASEPRLEGSTQPGSPATPVPPSASGTPPVVESPRVRVMQRAPAKRMDSTFGDIRRAAPVVINLAADDTTEEEESEDENTLLPSEASFSLGLDQLLKEARMKAQVPPSALFPQPREKLGRKASDSLG